MTTRINADQIINTFIRYTTINTTSVADNQQLPSCENQYKLAQLVADEFATESAVETTINDNAITVLSLAANNPEMPSIVFFAHLDTAPDNANDTHAVRVKNYDGTDIVLPATGDAITVEAFPELLDYIGQEIITTDGTSLLGADDKAAIAAGVEAIRYMLATPDFKHGDIKLVLLPDEEIGIRGAKALNVAALNADFGICLDCCGIGEYVVENWYAGSAKMTFKGVTAHPMSAKGKLVNAVLIANEVINALPEAERPELTEGREGYFWVNKISGNTVSATLEIALRDFEVDGYQNRKATLRSITEQLQNRYGHDNVILELSDTYDNVKAGLDKKPEIIASVQQAMRNLGIEPKPLIMRGGYDGSVITPAGLPTVNIFTGAHNFHSTKEFLPAESLRLASEMLLEIITLSAQEVSA
ncbi:peptidase T [Buttiauxella sp. A2-C1_F]|uniref:peptidase T n=1 Tax=unclassified Buttiauxella TaxID=2634062 RepID=UPI001E3791AE|nr:MULTISPECIES: peptidase T [unclassified Buttiauxella]MCE0811780.1 peptidase T [Buttiauxella sp. S04-F03]MCE0845477.1 peptidase T [Buttiauxella sp. A2-C1_F]